MKKDKVDLFEDLIFSGLSFGPLTCEKAELFLKKISFFAGLAILSSSGQNVEKAYFKKLGSFRKTIAK